MATTGTEKHFRLCLMLMKAGTKAACSLLLKRVKDICPEDYNPFPWSLDDFLLSRKKKILKLKQGREKAHVLFPKGKGTDLSKWDLSLVCCILTHFCALPSLLRLDVERLRTIRNELCHVSEPTVDHSRFTDYLKTIKVVVERILEESEEECIKCEVQRIVRDIEKEPLCLEETLREMHKFYSMERDIREKLDQMSEVEEAVLAKVQNFDLLLDKKVQPLEKKLEKINKKLDKKHRETSGPFHFPSLEFHFDLTNLSPEKEEQMSTVLVELFEEAINQDEDYKSKLPAESYFKLREVVNKTVRLFMSRGWQIVQTKRKCVQLDIRCNSFVSLADFFRSYINGEFEVAFVDLQGAVSKITAEDVTIVPVIYKDEFWNVMFQTLSLLEDYLPENIDEDAAVVNDAQNYLLLTTRKLESGRVSTDAKDFQNIGVHSCLREIENALWEEFGEPDVRLRAKCVEIAEVSSNEGTVGGFYSSKEETKDEKSDVRMIRYDRMLSDNFEELRIATKERVEKTGGFQTIAAFELYRAQIYIANFLELACIYLYFHIDIANEVLSVAQSAYTLHTESQKLLLNMHRVAKDVRRHMSLLADGISVQKASLLEKKMHYIIPLAQDLQTETETILKRYNEIRESTSKIIAQCKTVQKRHRDNTVERQLQEYAQEERHESNRMMNDIIKEVELIRDKSFTQNEQRPYPTYELKTVTEERKCEYEDPPVAVGEIEFSELHCAGNFEDKDLARVRQMDTLNEEMLAATLRPGTALTGGIKGTTLETQNAHLNIFDMFNEESEENILDSLMKCYVDSLPLSRHDLQQQQSVLDKVFRKHADALKSQNKIEGHDGVNSLHEVITQFQYLEIQLARVSDCWSYMVTLMTMVSGMLVADDSCLTVELIPFIELLSCISIEWGWFESICLDYVNASDSHVKKLYEFLSVNVENMADEERSRREKQLLKEMEDRIKRTTSPQEVR